MTCTIGGGWIEEDTLMYTRKRQSHVLCEAGCALAKVLTVVRVDQKNKLKFPECMEVF